MAGYWDIDPVTEEESSFLIIVAVGLSTQINRLMYIGHVLIGPRLFSTRHSRLIVWWAGLQETFVTVSTGDISIRWDMRRKRRGIYTSTRKVYTFVGNVALICWYNEIRRRRLERVARNMVSFWLGEVGVYHYTHTHHYRLGLCSNSYHCTPTGTVLVPHRLIVLWRNNQ
jgi:hypothetical protein